MIRLSPTNVELATDVHQGNGLVAADAERLVPLGQLPTADGIPDQNVVEDPELPGTIDLRAAFSDAEDPSEELSFTLVAIVLTGDTGQLNGTGLNGMNLVCKCYDSNALRSISRG